MFHRPWPQQGIQPRVSPTTAARDCVVTECDVAVCLVLASNQEAVASLPPTAGHAGGDSSEALEVGGRCGKQESPGERDASLLHPRSGASQTRALHSGATAAR